jgi:Nuclease-related domain/AAA domain
VATLYPSEIIDDHGSGAERRIFRKLKGETPDDWYGVHSLGLTKHPDKPWAEIDFVAVTDAGVFCLEVKGGRISREGGVWMQNEHEMRQSPFAQVGGASAALHRYLSGRFPEIDQAMTGYGVVMPDVAFDVKGPDVEGGVVYDDDDLARPFEEYLERLAKHWAEKLAAKRRGGFRPLSPAQRRRILNAIAPDFALVPSLRAQVAAVEADLVRLTKEQTELLQGMTELARVAIRGSAGTGKTLLALHEAQRLAREGKRVLLCCFSKALAADLRARLAGETADVHHFHGLMSELVREAGLTSTLPEDVEATDLFDVFYPQATIDALAQLDRLGCYDAVIIDEGQDLLRDLYVQVFDALLEGELEGGTWRLFHDPIQDRFGGMDPAVLDRMESLAESQYRLHKNCRNTKQVIISTSILTALPIAEALRVDGPDVVELWYDDEVEQLKLASKQIRSWLTDGLSPDQIVVLSPRRFESSSAARLTNVQFATDPHAPDADGVRFATIAGFKGLEADAVLVLDLQGLETSHELLEIYLSTTRARAVLAVALNRSFNELYAERARDFADRLAAGAL